MPNQSDQIATVALASFKRADYRKAAALFEQAIKLSVDSAHSMQRSIYYYNLASSYHHLNQLPESIKACQQCLDIREASDVATEEQREKVRGKLSLLNTQARLSPELQQSTGAMTASLLQRLTFMKQQAIKADESKSQLTPFDLLENAMPKDNAKIVAALDSGFAGRLQTIDSHIHRLLSIAPKEQFSSNTYSFLQLPHVQNSILRAFTHVEISPVLTRHQILNLDISDKVLEWVKEANTQNSIDSGAIQFADLASKIFADTAPTL